MTTDKVVAFRVPVGFSPGPLTDLLRQGARQLIAQAVEAELNGFLASHAGQTDDAGRTRLVGHSHLPDITPDALITPLKAGKIHLPQTADRVDDQMTPLVRQMAIEGPCDAAGRLQVYTGSDKGSDWLVRKTGRRANSLNAGRTALQRTQPNRAPPRPTGKPPKPCTSPKLWRPRSST